MSLGPFGFAAPGWLVLLVAAAYLYVAWRRFAVLGGAAPALRFVPALRAGAAALLVLALAGAHWRALVPGVDIHVLMDRSASMGTEDRSRSRRVVETLHDLLGPHDRLALYSFGRQTFLDAPLSRNAAAAGIEVSVPDPTGTNLEAALRAALEQVDPAANTRFLLLSDGIETEADAAAVLPILEARGIPVDVFVLGQAVDAETAVDYVLAPGRMTAGEPYVVRAIVSATLPTPAVVSLYREGELVAEQSIVLAAGRNVISFAELREPPDAPGSVRFELRVRAERDTFSENNVGYAVAQAQSAAPVLVVSDDSGAAAVLRALLADQEMTVEAAAADGVPVDPERLAAYQAVVIHNVPADQFSRRQMEALTHYVDEIGGGLLVIGGDRSFGLGGYQNTPIEALLPVSMDAPQSVIMPSLAMVLVLDRSGSMAETQGAFSKLDLAKEASLGVLDVTQDHDLLGVIAFDSAPHWVVPLQPVENRFAFAGPIASIVPEGGTNIGPALEEAHKALRQVDASVKHVILLSDGISAPAEWDAIAAAMRADGITTSTVGIGRDADRELLAQLAAWGDGRAYFTDDIHTVPQIFATETILVSRPIRVDEPFVPQWYQQADFWTPEAPLPALGGYVITTAKAAAAVHLQAPDGSPILSTWRHGLGRTAAFTSSLAGPWGEQWRAWPLSGAFWGRLLRWLMRSGPTEGLMPQLTLDGAWGYLTVDAIDAAGRYLNFLDLEATVWTPAGEQLRLTLAQTSPGRYAAQFPAAAQGIYLATVRERPPAEAAATGESGGAPGPGEALAGMADGAAGQPPVTVGAVLSYPDEYRILRPETGLMYRIAQGTGGRIVRAATPEELAPLLVHPHPGRRERPLTPILLGLAFVLFFADILIRYLTADRIEAVRSRVAALLARSGGGDTPERRLQVRMDAERRHLEEIMRRQDVSAVAETERSRGAGRYLAARRKRQR